MRNKCPGRGKMFKINQLSLVRTIPDLLLPLPGAEPQLWKEEKELKNPKKNNWGCSGDHFKHITRSLQCCGTSRSLRRPDCTQREVSHTLQSPHVWVLSGCRPGICLWRAHHPVLCWGPRKAGPSLSTISSPPYTGELGMFSLAEQNRRHIYSHLCQ